MSYAILRTSKLKDKSKTSSAAEHNFRIRQQANIDASKTPENKILYNPLNVDTSKTGALASAIETKYKALGVKERKNSVFAQEFVISASPEYFENKEKEEIEAWAKQQNRFMLDNFGENVVISCLHLDEKTPHLHFIVSTEEKKRENTNQGKKQRDMA